VATTEDIQEVAEYGSVEVCMATPQVNIEIVNLVKYEWNADHTSESEASDNIDTEEMEGHPMPCEMNSADDIMEETSQKEESVHVTDRQGGQHSSSTKPEQDNVDSGEVPGSASVDTPSDDTSPKESGADNLDTMTHPDDDDAPVGTSLATKTGAWKDGGHYPDTEGIDFISSTSNPYDHD
jgi:hypothetical protein